MSNPVTGHVPLTLKDGRQFTLVLDMEALVEAETVYGKPMRRMMADASQEFFGAVRAVLYGALRAKHPNITPREASSMLQTDADAVSAALEAAGKAGFDQGEGSEGKEAAHPPGKRSGRNGARPGSTPISSGEQRHALSP